MTAVGVAHHGTLGDFEHEIGRVELAGRQHRRHVRPGFGVRQLVGREVDADADVRRNEAPRLPVVELGTCFGEDETVDHVDEPDLFGEGDEGSRAAAVPAAGVANAPALRSR